MNGASKISVAGSLNLSYLLVAMAMAILALRSAPELPQGLEPVPAPFVLQLLVIALTLVGKKHFLAHPSIVTLKAFTVEKMQSLDHFAHRCMWDLVRLKPRPLHYLRMSQPVCLRKVLVALVSETAAWR